MLGDGNLVYFWESMPKRCSAYFADIVPGEGQTVMYLNTFSATALVRELAEIRSAAVHGPVAITSHGRIELAILSAEQFDRMSSEPAAESLSRIEAKLDTVLETIDTHIVIMNSDLSMRRVNRAARLTLGLPDKSYKDQPVTTILPSALNPYLVRRLHEVVASGRPAEFDFESIINPGRTIHARMVPWPGGVAYFADDITDRLLSVETELENVAVENAMAALGSRGSGIANNATEIVRVDEGLCGLLGASREKVVGSKITALFDPTSRLAIEESVQLSRLETRVIDVQYLDHGVDLRPGKLSLSQFLGADGHPRVAFALCPEAD